MSIIVNEADYAWERSVLEVVEGTTPLDPPMRIYAVKGAGTAYLDAETVQPVTAYPVAVDSITVIGGGLTLIGERAKTVPVAGSLLDTTEGMAAQAWSSRSDKFAITLPFPFLWNGVETTELTLYAYGTLCLSGTSTGVRIHSYWLSSWGEPTNGIHTQIGETMGKQFLKVRFDGYCYYSSKTDAYRSVWELFLFSDGTIFVNSITCPTVSTVNALYPAGSAVSFTVVKGGSQAILAKSEDQGVTWIFDYFDAAQKTTLFLVRKDNVLHTVTDGALTALADTVVTAALFLEHGFEALSAFAPEGEYTVLSWSTGNAPAMTATVTGSPPPQDLTCTVDLSHPSISGIQQMTAEYSGTVELSHRTDGDWSEAVSLGEWVAQDADSIWQQLGEDGLLHLKFILYGGAKLTRFKLTFQN